LRAELTRLGFRPASSIQPKYTLVIPLGDDPMMLAGFRRRTRYSVRAALHRGVVVEEGSNAFEMARLTAATSTRQGLYLPGHAYYQTLLDELLWCRTYVARYGGKTLAAALVSHFDRRAYYLFAGWSGERPDLMSSYAVMWEAMRAAARAGCRDFDLWGVPATEDAAHPWYGLGLFKRGFGGVQVEYVGGWDLPLSRTWHEAVSMEERARRWVRRIRRPRRRRRA
jgi:lipid II:glycine glycyltransferase (peptidoglycan interpeptide bridge formation enzyme)